MNGGIADLLIRWNGQVTSWLARIAAFVLGLVAVVTFCDVIARYFFNRPFSFTVEGTELAMGLIVFLGVGLTTHENGHISVDVITIRLSETTRAILGLVTNILAIGFVFLMVWRLWLRAEVLYTKGDLTQVLLYPIWPVAFVMAAGSIFYLTGLFVHVIEAVRQITTPRASPSPPPTERPYSE